MLSLNQVAKAAVVLVVAWAIVFSERDGSHTPESLKTFQTDRRGYFVSHQGFSIKTRWWPVKTQELKAVVFFVHGMAHSSNSEMYQHFITELRHNGYGVYAHDMQGHGLSSGERNYFEYFFDLVQELQQFMILALEGYDKTTKFYVIGHDLGSLVALELGRYLGRGFQGMVYGGLPWHPNSWRILENTPELLKDQINKAFPKVASPFSLSNTTLQLRPVLEILKVQKEISDNWKEVDWPTLCLHSTFDSELPTSHVEEFLQSSISTDKKLLIADVPNDDIFGNVAVIQKTIEWLDDHLRSTWDSEKRDDVPEGQCQPPPQVMIERID